MAIIQADSPFPLFTDKGGDPLDGGFVYFGEPDLNPEESPKTVYYDAALAIATPQPLRTSNGYITRNGAPAAIYSDGAFSMTVRDRNSALVFYSPRTFLPDGFVLSDRNPKDVSALLANTSLTYTAGQDGTVTAGDIIRTLAEGFAYEVAVSGATNEHVTTAGGVKLYVQQDASGYNIKAFGAVGDGATDDRVAISTAVIAANGAALYFPSGTYLLSSSLSLEVDNTTVHGEGKILCGAVSGGLTLTGDGNTVSGLTIYRTTKSTSPTVIFSGAGLFMVGNDCRVRDVEIYNMEGPGIKVGLGYRAVIDGVYSHDNIMGLHCQASTRDITVSNSQFIDNNVNSGSGANGILFTRSVTGAMVQNCVINGNGEHGLYFQGQRLVVSGCTVNENGADGLKFGSYDDGNYAYAGETLDTWVPGSSGVTGFAGVNGADGYGCRHILIENNIIQDNAGEDGIYFQPSAKDVRVEGNELKNNRIRFVFFNDAGARLEDIIDIRVTNNTLTGAGTLADIEVSASFGVYIAGNNIEGKVFPFAPNAATAPRLSQVNDAPEVRDNVCADIDIGRSADAVVVGNTTVDFSVAANCTDTNVIDNIISGLTASVDMARVEKFNGNDVTVVGNIAFSDSAGTFGFPEEFKDNKIVGNSFTSSYFVDASFNSGRPVSGIFSNNYIECTSCARVVYGEGDGCVVSGNVLVNDGSTDLVIDVFGDAFCITGNVIPTGNINIRTDAKHVVVGNRVNSVVDASAGTTNVIASNG